jgi:hypothetical protein
MIRFSSLSSLLVVVAAAAVALASCTLDPDALPPDLEFTIPVEEAWPVTPLVGPPAGETRAFVTNNLDDTVTVVDIDALLAGRNDDVVLAQVPVGFVPVEREGPHHVTTDGEHYYLGISNFVQGAGSGPHGQHGSGDAEGHILKLRVSDNGVAGAVRIDRNPGDVRLTPDGSTLLASHFDQLRIIDAAQQGIEEGPELDSKLAIVDPVTMTRTALVAACPAAHGIGVTADSSTAVLSCVSDEVAIVELATQAVTRVPLLDAPGSALAPVCFPYAVTMDDNVAWTSCFNTGEIIAVNAASKERDGRSFQLLGQIGMFGEVRDGIMAVAHQNDDGVTLLDVSDAAAVTLSSFKLFAANECVSPHAARWSADGARVIVVCEGDQVTPGSLIAIDAAAPHAVVGSALMGIYPDDVAVVP